MTTNLAEALKEARAALHKKAQDLYDIRQMIAEKEEFHRAEMKNLKEIRDLRQEELLQEMREIGEKSVKLESGDSFARTTKKGLAITNIGLAQITALKLKAVKPDLVALAKLLKDEKKLPKGFERVETEYISVRKAKA